MDCGAPLSVRAKSSALRPKTTLPSPPVTKTGTMTRLERTVSLTWGSSGCCWAAQMAVRDSNRARVRRVRIAGFGVAWYERVGHGLRRGWHAYGCKWLKL